LAKGGNFKMPIGKEIKRLRGRDSQQQLAFDLNVSRESVSAYETERAKVPKDITQQLMSRFDDGHFALELAHDYTGGSWAPALNGPAVDLYKTSVQNKTIEEIQEAYESIKKAVLNVQPNFIGNFEKQDIEKSLDEAADAVTALNTYIMVICKEYRISWIKVWARHQSKLISRGFLKLIKRNER
jgi:transcriptional regulator with XRE-family HTH domain